LVEPGAAEVAFGAIVGNQKLLGSTTHLAAWVTRRVIEVAGWPLESPVMAAWLKLTLVTFILPNSGDAYVR
jgi:hypothetical protein